ncbi:thrombospondin-1-like [Mercenaria mercenaria]|uniref:thrombospondin-1-like n=1 Tax=Mercenaria mercenaria TaxID=6596 RepID=UPI00234F0227|nr:thrombospondin-1-like [Mercenaria mercenaria]
MRSDIVFAFILCLVTVILTPCCCGKVKKYQSNGRNSNVKETHTVRSLSECAVLLEKSENSLSVNFNQDKRKCELSEIFPENSTVAAEGWKVYTKIVNGAWTDWMSWSTCSETCNGTRKRSRSCTDPPPSNGGLSCFGYTTENETCYEQSCFLEDKYYIGEENVTWESAKVGCEIRNASLVILESQGEIDFLEAIVIEFEHWIGMRCNNDTNCTWIDGRSVEGGFKAWAPNEPTNTDCVWIGYYGNRWDDTYCDKARKYICEF